MIRFAVLVLVFSSIAGAFYFEEQQQPENYLEFGQNPYAYAPRNPYAGGQDVYLDNVQEEEPMNHQFEAFQELDAQRDLQRKLEARHELQRQQIEREMTLASDPDRQQDLNGQYEEELRIPGETPKTNDSYLCTAFRQTDARYVVSFEPLDTKNAHHVIVFACDAPGVQDAQPYLSWDCGEMSTNQPSDPSSFVKAPPCASNSAPIYAWSHGAGDAKTGLPEGAAFPMGGRNQYIVLQVHYMNALAPEEKDYSGVKIRYTYEKQPKTAATLLLVTGGEVASKSQENFEAACVVDEQVVIHPVAFRVHTHRHGKVVSGWVVRKDENNVDQWTLLGQRDPQKPQIFEPVRNTSLVINQGDVLAHRCTIQNNENHSLAMGPTSEDEMCNFYLIYWTEGTPLQNNICMSPGAPDYHWKDNSGLNNTPN